MAKKAKKKLSKAHLAKMQAGRKKWLKSLKTGKETGKKTGKKTAKKTAKKTGVLGTLRNATVIINP